MDRDWPILGVGTQPLSIQRLLADRQREMNGIAPCPDRLPHQVAELIRQCGELWKKDPNRPRPSQQVISEWDSALSAWIADESLPLYVRKFKDNRGSLIQHSSGRFLVPVDNSPAQWAYDYACGSGAIEISEIRRLIAADGIPVAMIHPKVERCSAKFRCTIAKTVNLNSKGWKLAHIHPVGLRSRTPLAELPLDRVIEHFTRLMSPRNMFVVPKPWAGIAELPEFIEQFAGNSELR